MIPFSALSEKSVMGRIARGLLAGIPASMTVRILQGPLRGKRWVKGAGVNGYWLGSYELPEQREFQKYVRRGDVVFDAGAHTGFYTMLAAELVGERGRVYAFEPFPRNIAFLKRHIAMNGYKNITVMEMAVGRKSGRARFAAGASTFTGKLDDAGGLEVEVATLDELVVRGVCPVPNFIKADIEGKFGELLEGAKDIITHHKPTLLFESDYTSEPHVFDLLRRAGYVIAPVGAAELASASNFIAHRS